MTQSQENQGGASVVNTHLFPTTPCTPTYSRPCDAGRCEALPQRLGRRPVPL